METDDGGGGTDVRKRTTSVERAWTAFALGVVVFASPLWDWIVRSGLWWIPYLGIALLVSGIAWVCSGDD